MTTPSPRILIVLALGLPLTSPHAGAMQPEPVPKVAPPANVLPPSSPPAQPPAASQPALPSADTPDRPAPAAPAPAAPPATPKSVVLESAPLTPPISVGDRFYYAVRLRGRLPGPGSIDFEPRTIAIDAFGRSARPMFRAASPTPVEFVEIVPRVKVEASAPEPAPAPKTDPTSIPIIPGPRGGAPAPTPPLTEPARPAPAPAAETWRVYTIRPVLVDPPGTSTGMTRVDWTGLVELRLAVAPGESTARRLLVIGPTGSVARVISLENAAE